MEQERDAISEMRVITISREYGSGGGEIAARLAHHLGWQLIDHEVIVRVAEALGISEATAKEHDEQAASLTLRILHNLHVVHSRLPVAVKAQLTAESRIYDAACRKVIADAVANGHVVIVGRGSQVLLGQRRDVFHVRIVAPLEQRIAYVMRREGLDRGAAQARIQLKDRDRVRYLQTHYCEHPADAHLYDIVVNTSVLDLESIVNVLVFALEHKARQLSTPAGEIGPATGLARYPGAPGDFRPPEHMSD